MNNIKTSSMPGGIIFQNTDYHKSKGYQKLFQKRNAIISAILMIIGLSSFGQTILAQDKENTKASPDQVLKSNARVNPSTLAMELAIPIASLPGRAGTSMPLVFNYSSKVWRVQGGASFDTGGIRWSYASPTYSEGTVSGWTSTYGLPTMTYAFDDSEVYDCQANSVGNTPEYGSENCDLYYVKRVRVTLPDGSSHEFLKDDGVYPAYPTDPSTPSIDRSGTFLAVDGSRMRLEMVSTNSGGSTLYLPDGSRYLFADNTTAKKFIDRNGNVLTYSSTSNGWTDTLGKTLSNPFPSPVPVNYSHPEVTQNINVPGIGSGTRTYQLVWKKLSNGALAAGEPNDYYDSDICPSVGRNNVLFVSQAPIRLCSNNGAGYFDPVVLTEVILPNGSKYKFEYNKFGEIVRIDYPIGGYEKFTYAALAPLSSTQKLPYDQANRGVVSRIVGVGDGATEYTWSYQAGYTGTVGDGSPYFVTTTAPDGTKTKQLLHRNQANRKNYGFDNPLTGREMETQVIDTLGNIRSRTLTEWETTNGVSPGFSANPKRDIRVKRVFNIINDPATGSLISMTENKYDTDASSDPAQFSSLNLKWSKTYDYKVLTTTIGIGDTAEALAVFNGATPAVISETTYLYDVNYRNRGIVGLPTQTEVKNGAEIVKAKTEITYDEPGYFETVSASNPPGYEAPGTNYRALPTTVKSWYDATNAQSFIATHTSYDQFGNPRKIWDGKGNVSEIDYADKYTDNVNRNTYAFPTVMTSAVPGGNGSSTAFVTTITYDFNTGLPIFTKDANNQISEIQYNDVLLRPTKTIAPNGQQTITEYGVPASGQLPASQRFVKSKTQIDANNWKEGYSWFDGLGRTIKSQSVDSSGDVFALVCYDAYGRQSKTSNPFRSTSNPGCSSTSLEWTTTTYDNAGRPWKVTTTPDNAVVETNYSLATAGSNIGTVVTVKDQALKERRSITNALGQLIRVDEPFENKDDDGNVTSVTLGTIASPAQPTNYSYDTLNNLTSVSQGTQNRSFTYDSLSRLKSASNPESGLTNYQYDASGNLTTKIDGRNITVNYLYDALNRVTQRSYSGETEYATPSVFYFYDNLPNAKGKLIKVSNSISATEFSDFDILGRALTHKQMTDGQTYSTSYVYNLSGTLTEQTYHSGRVVRNVLDADGDLAEVESKKNSSDVFRNYATNFVYTASGAISSLRLGNGRFENTVYNSRLQPIQIGLGSSATNQNLLKLNFDYGTTDNNGNVKSQTITIPTIGNVQGFAALQTYSYDSLNRLKQARETINNNQTQNWKQTFNYDRFGNRRFDESNGNTTTLLQNCPTAVCNPQVDPATNKLIGYQFDNVGNTKTDAENRTYIYDGDNRQVKVKDAYGNSIGTYFYDGDGKRVKKISLTETTLFIYNSAGQLVAEYSTNISQQAQTSYMTTDHLGSPRINTNAVGQVISRHDYQPFGEEVQRANYNADNIRKKFTGYERDAETNLDYAQARMFRSGFGRFTSPDPALISARADNPQTWNRYVYVLNSPLKFIDPFGLWELQYEPEYEKNDDGTYNTSKVKTMKIFFRKSKTGDNADRLLEQLGFKAKDDGYGAMKSQIEGAMKNMGEMGIQASSLKGSVDGINIGETFKTIGNLLGDQANYDVSHPGNALTGKKGPSDSSYNDCSMTTARLTFPILQTRDLTPDNFGVEQMDDNFVGGLDQAQNGSLRLLDIVRYSDSRNSVSSRHFMSAIFTGDDGTTQAFSRSGVNGKFQVVPVDAFNGTNYGNIRGVRSNHTGFYRR